MQARGLFLVRIGVALIPVALIGSGVAFAWGTRTPAPIARQSSPGTIVASRAVDGVRILQVAAGAEPSAAAPSCATALNGVAPQHPGHCATGNRDPIPGYVTRLARSEAASNGDPSPISAEAVLTNGRNAARVADEVFAGPGHGPKLYLVILRGHFVDKHAFEQSGASPPKGSHIEFEIGLRDHTIWEFGLGWHAPDLRGLGTIHRLTLAPAGAAT